jgi:transposase-like protein
MLPGRRWRTAEDDAARERRPFSAEFKLEAVHRMVERRAAGVPQRQVARELDVRADLLLR